MLDYKPKMSAEERDDFEKSLKEEFIEHKSDTQKDLEARINGVSGTRGASTKQFAGYQTLQEFYRGDQWDSNEPPGASQRAENYCASIVDTFSSLLFDAPAEIHCESQDPTDEVLELKAEIKEKLLDRVYEENDANEIVFPDLSKNGSLYGDTFLKGPMIDKSGGNSRKDWKIVFYCVENPANIRPIFMDQNYIKLYGFIDTTPVSPMWLMKHKKDKLDDRGIDINKLINKKRQGNVLVNNANMGGQQTYQKFIQRHEYWTDKVMAEFIEDELIDWWYHDWGFVPIEYIKNNKTPNYPYGKSDLEDVLDPQMFLNRTNNDLANALKFLSTITLTGKNLDGMEVLVHGLSKIFNLPEDGELQGLARSGDPYASSNFVESRRRTLLDISGLSEALLATSSGGQVSGRALSVAMQSVIRKLSPRIKRYQKALKSLNTNILTLMEKYWPETKEVIMGDYSNKVDIISTLLRNIIDELNKMQAGVQSLTTTQRNLGIPQPKIEQKVMKRDLSDPVLGPQTARQPALLQLSSPEATPGTPGSNGQENLNPEPGNPAAGASPEGAVAASNQQAAAAPVPQVIP